MEVGGEEHAGRRQSEANGAESETFLFTEIIRHGSGSSAADDAPDEGAPGGPSCARRVKMKELAQIANGAADHNVVVICLRGERVCHSQFGYDTLPPTESAAACSQNSSRRFGPGTGDARRWPAR